mgnify:CR=1 FL=1
MRSPGVRIVNAVHEPVTVALPAVTVTVPAASVSPSTGSGWKYVIPTIVGRVVTIV